VTPEAASYGRGGAGWSGRASGSGVASQTFTVPSSEALASRPPSGLKHTLHTKPVCPFRESVSWPVAKSHTLTVPSREALASRRPSGLKHTLSTVACAALKASVSFPVAASQTLTVPSSEALASRQPSGLKHTP